MKFPDALPLDRCHAQFSPPCRVLPCCRHWQIRKTPEPTGWASFLEASPPCKSTPVFLLNPNFSRYPVKVSCGISDERNTAPVLMDFSKIPVIVCVPYFSWLKFETVSGPMVTDPVSTKVVSGVILCSSNAIAMVKGLNTDPGSNSF